VIDIDLIAGSLADRLTTEGAFSLPAVCRLILLHGIGFVDR